MAKLSSYLFGKSYPGRGIVLGLAPGGEHAVLAYFIMGRSENSRNRVLVRKEGALFTRAADPEKLRDPSLILYAPIRTVGKQIIVTNGDQTDTIEAFLKEGKTMAEALETRSFEPDSPNWTPRISGLLLPEERGYCLSILKAGEPEGKSTVREFFHYALVPGTGHLIHTYQDDAAPLPSFQGEPVKVEIPESQNSFTAEIWESLHPENRISLCTEWISLRDGTLRERIVNRFTEK